ncbi:MAG: diguanylate cyclase, partial [Holophagaceae bacterium]|nr:diguanylate cyclase [Holophagaceae bacterium]
LKPPAPDPKPNDIKKLIELCEEQPLTRELLSTLADLSVCLAPTAKGEGDLCAEPPTQAQSASQLMTLSQWLSMEVFMHRLVRLAEEDLLRVERRPVVSAEILDEIRLAFLHHEVTREHRLDIRIEPSHPFHTDSILLISTLIFMIKAGIDLAPPKESIRLWMERGGSYRHFYLQFKAPEGERLDLSAWPKLYPIRLLAERCLGGKFTAHQGATGPISLTLTLPDADQPARPRPHAAPSQSQSETLSPGLGRCTILAADDSKTIRLLIRGILGKDHDLVMAGDGLETLKIARETRPDLILLDVIMPGMNGFAVCKALKEDPLTSDIPVLFLTALSGDMDEALALSGGAADFIIKPISPPVLAARVKNHLELKRSRDMLKALTLLDGLTGIANRRRFDEQLQQEWLRCGRRAKPLSVILGDVDFFKCYNDGYGHVEGDECLRRVAKAIAGSLHRPGDLAARYGGEEFVCILPETDQEGARAVAEAIQAAVAALQLPHEFSEVADHVTISLGVATAWPGECEVPEDLTRHADQNMYEAKRLGRNQVIG